MATKLTAVKRWLVFLAKIRIWWQGFKTTIQARNIKIQSVEQYWGTVITVTLTHFITNPCMAASPTHARICLGILWNMKALDCLSEWNNVVGQLSLMSRRIYWLFSDILVLAIKLHYNSFFSLVFSPNFLEAFIFHNLYSGKDVSRKPVSIHIRISTHLDNYSRNGKGVAAANVWSASAYESLQGSLCFLT